MNYEYRSNRIVELCVRKFEIYYSNVYTNQSRKFEGVCKPGVSTFWDKIFDVQIAFKSQSYPSKRYLLHKTTHKK